MDAPAQVQAYAEADFSESNQAFVDRVLSEFKSPQNGRLIDLGCGPGDICLRLAHALPNWHILGVDAGKNMLATAQQYAQTAGLDQRIEYRQTYLPDESLPQQHFDLVVSNSLLHHMPDPATLWQTVTQLAKPGAWVQVMDLARPADDQQARTLVDIYADDAPDILRTDFFNSLKAAWTVDEVEAQLQTADLDLNVERISDRHWLASGQIRA